MKKINPGIHGQDCVRKLVNFRHSQIFNSVIFSKSKITDLKSFYWPLKWSMFRLNRSTPSKVTPWNVGQSLRKIRKKSPTWPTWHGDFSEQARVSDLVSTLKLILGIVLSNPHIVFRIWEGRPDGVFISAGITPIWVSTLLNQIFRKFYKSLSFDIWSILVSKITKNMLRRNEIGCKK
jgi:hypothetical protein